MRNKAVIIGAGNTGRGFIARLARESGYNILFIDKDKSLVRRLNEEKQYRIDFFGDIRPSFEIDRYRAVDWENTDIDDIAEDDIIFVSVGGRNLKEAGEQFKKFTGNGIFQVIVCENAVNAAQTFKDAAGGGIVGGRINLLVSEGTVFCTSVESEGLNILSEDYPYLQYDVEAFDNNSVAIHGLVPVIGFEDFLKRKFYTYNAASCIITYLGWIKGYKLFGEAANDPDILRMLDINYAETNMALCAEYGYSEKDQREFALISREKFCDKNIIDTIERNARDPYRKITPEERIVGTLRFIEKHGGNTQVLEMTLAAMLMYDRDEEWNLIKETKSDERILSEICGFSKDLPRIKRIIQCREYFEK